MTYEPDKPIDGHEPGTESGGSDHPRRKRKHIKPEAFGVVKPVCKKEGCPIKGEQHPQCKAHNRMKLPCKKTPMEGQFVCDMHGGKSYAGIQRGKLRQAVTMAQKLVQFNPDDPEGIEEGLLREVRQSSQTARVWGEIVGQLQGLTQRTPRDGEVLAAAVDAWTKERVTHAKLAQMAINAGLDKRKMELAESQATQMVWLMVQLLQHPDLGLNRSQVLVGKRAAAELLRDLPTGEQVAIEARVLD